MKLGQILPRRDIPKYFRTVFPETTGKQSEDSTLAKPKGCARATGVQSDSKIGNLGPSKNGSLWDDPRTRQTVGFVERPSGLNVGSRSETVAGHAFESSA